MGSNKREQCIQLVHKKGNTSWKGVTIIVFDAPQEADKTYAQRLSWLEQRKYFDYEHNIL
jgi:hypothetical protein